MHHKPQLPPGSRLPALVQAAYFLTRPTEFLLANHRKYGAAYTIRFPFVPLNVAVSDPEVIRAVFVGDPEVLHAGKSNNVLRPIVGSHSLLLLDGAIHKRDRKLMTPPFHGERMLAYGAAMRDCIQRHIDEWPSGKSFKFHAAMQKVTLEIILVTVFGLQEADVPRFAHALEPFMAMSSDPRMLLLMGRNGEIKRSRLDEALGPLGLRQHFESLQAEVRAMLLGEIAARRKNPGPDILSMLIEARFDDGTGMSDDELHDEMLTMLVAGHETTATSLTWSMIHLCQNHQVAQKLRAEVDSVGGGDTVPMERLGDLHYTLMVIKESLRRTPIIPLLGRRLMQATTFEHLTLPEGVHVAPNIYVTHHREDIWPEPFAFKPERWQDLHPKPWHFLPFGGGNRTCLGMGFAYYEMKIVLAEIMRSCDIQLAPGYRPRVVLRNITLAPTGGVPVEMQRR